MKSLQNSVIIVDGGSGGIGSFVYKKLLLENAQVIGISRTENLQLKKFTEKNKLEYNWIISDLASKSGWEEAANKIKDKFGKIDILINCVGMLIPGKVENLTYEQIRQIISSNLTSFVLASKAIIPLMKKQGSGHIINLGSLGGIVTMPYESLYCATKFASRGFTLSLKNELKDFGIKVSLISPGPVLTNMLIKESLDPDSAIAFLNRPLTADYAAKKIIHTIVHPKTEIILPPGLKLPVFLLNLCPRLFDFFFPLFNMIGKRNQKKFSFLPNVLEE
jgi:short-subunit dehydrogenase